MLFMDLDGFKQVNDTFGHEKGDHVLRTVAHTIERNVRHNDDVGRHGGDEFIVLLGHGAHEADAQVIAARLVRELAKPMAITGMDLTIGASAGLAVAADAASTTRRQLIAMADAAMYRAKLDGGNSCVTA